MNRLDDDLETARSVFVAHRAACKQCQQFDFAHTGGLVNLCYFGTQRYKELLTAEHKYMLHVNAIERAKERRREQAKEHHPNRWPT